MRPLSSLTQCPSNILKCICLRVWPLILLLLSYLQSPHFLLKWLESWCIPVKRKDVSDKIRDRPSVWTRLTCLYALPEVWENGDTGPWNGRRSRIFTPLEVMLSDTQCRQCRIFLKMTSGAKKFWFSWKHNQEISEWATWEEESMYVSKIPVCNS